MELFKNCKGFLVNMGPGEGISSMVLGTIFPGLQIVSIEQDDLHIEVA
jgi:hypothetical protein